MLPFWISVWIMWAVRFVHFVQLSRMLLSLVAMMFSVAISSLSGLVKSSTSKGHLFFSISSYMRVFSRPEFETGLSNSQPACTMPRLFRCDVISSIAGMVSVTFLYEPCTPDRSRMQRSLPIKIAAPLSADSVVMSRL